MKKTAAIFLFALLAFNWFGYRVFMNLLEQKASTDLQHKLDIDQYDNSNLVEMRIPVSLPYLTNWSSFEKVQGETEINGIHYKYVKRKLVNDTLVLLCIANPEKNKLRTAQSDYFQQINDLQSTNKKSGPAKDHSTKVPIADYLLKESNIISVPVNEAAQHHSNYFDKLSFLSRLVAEKPPEC